LSYGRRRRIRLYNFIFTDLVHMIIIEVHLIYSYIFKYVMIWYDT
jgi:hypothetical protein